MGPNASTILWSSGSIVQCCHFYQAPSTVGIQANRSTWGRRTGGPYGRSGRAARQRRMSTIIGSAGCYVDSVRGEAFHGRTSISPARWCQLVELARELERHLIVVVAHRRCGIGTQVEDFIKLQNNGDRVLHFLGRHDFVVDFGYPRVAATDDKVFLFLVRQAMGSAA